MEPQTFCYLWFPDDHQESTEDRAIKIPLFYRTKRVPRAPEASRYDQKSIGLPLASAPGAPPGQKTLKKQCKYAPGTEGTF